MPRTRRDRGSVSLVAIGLIAVAAVLVAAVGAASTLAVAGSRAQGAADACALAVAYEARDARASGVSPAEACASGRVIADRWGVVLERCSVGKAGDAMIEVSDRVFGITVTGRSRAGSWNE